MREVCERTTLSLTQIHELVAREQFPYPVTLGTRAKAFVEVELDAWLASRLVARADLEPGLDNAVLPQWTPELALRAIQSEHFRQGIHMQRLKEVASRVALKKSEIYRRIPTGAFPAPVPLGIRARAWAKHEIDAWIEDQIEKRRQDPGFWFLTQRPPKPSGRRGRSDRRPTNPGSRVVRPEFGRRERKKDKDAKRES